jgi:hypothetical protein
MIEPCQWRKSSRSGSTGNCVEVAANLQGVIAVRDSKDPDGPLLTFPLPIGPHSLPPRAAATLTCPEPTVAKPRSTA